MDIKASVSHVNLKSSQPDITLTTPNSPLRVQECRPQPISLAENYNLFYDNENVGSIHLRKIVRVRSMQKHTRWTITAIQPSFKLQSENNTQTQLPELVDVVTELSKRSNPNCQIDGNEYHIEEGGGCTDLIVQLDRKREHVFQRSGELTLISSSGKKESVCITPTETHEQPPVELLAASCSLSEGNPNIPKPEMNDLLEAIDQINPMESFLKEPETLRIAIANNHHKPDLSQIFMFGSNYECVLNEVYKSEKKSSLYCLINPLSVAKTDWAKGFVYSAHGQELVPVFEGGKLSTVVQKDPEDDEAPCGIEYRFTPSLFPSKNRAEASVSFAVLISALEKPLNSHKIRAFTAIFEIFSISRRHSTDSSPSQLVG